MHWGGSSTDKTYASENSPPWWTGKRANKDEGGRGHAEDGDKLLIHYRHNN